MGRARLQSVVRELQPLHRRALGPDRARQQPGCGSGRSHRSRCLHGRTLAADDAEPTRRPAAQAWRSRCPQCGPAGRDRSAGQRQADRRDARASSTTCRSGTTTSAGSPTRSKAASSLWTRRATSTSPATNRWVWWSPSRPGTRRLLLTAWKLAPALAAGNTVVIKPSEFTSVSTLEFVKLVEEAGISRWRGERCDRLRQRGRHAARRASADPQDRFHRVGCHRAAHQRSCCARLQEGRPGAGRQVAQHRVRRRRTR